MFLVTIAVDVVRDSMTNRGPDRRRFLERTAVVAGTISLAGCVTTPWNGESNPPPAGGDSPDESGTDSPPAPENGTSEETTQGNEVNPRTVSFEAPHGATIEATAYGSGGCGIVMVPQINKDRESWKPQAKTVAEMGHWALAIDEDPDDRPGSVRGAIRYLRDQQGLSTVLLLGASSGGEAVVVANAESEPDTVDGTITLSAGGGVDHASDLQGRSLFVVSTNDDDRFVRVARELHEQAPKPKELVEYEGSAHGQQLFESDHAANLRDRIQTLISDVCED